jgi:hypothetical protein
MVPAVVAGDRRLVATADRTGIGGWWWSHDARTASLLVGRTEADLLLAGVPRRVDRCALAAMLVGLEPDSARSRWEPIAAVPAGHRLVAESPGAPAADPAPTSRPSAEQGVASVWELRGVATVRLERWAVDAPLDPSLDHDRAVRLFREAASGAMADTVEAAAGRVGAMLSGGLDSSCIVGTLRRLGADPLVLSARYPGLPSDESAWQDAVLAGTGLRHLTVTERAVDLDSLSSAARRTGRPAVRPDAEYDVLLMEAASHGIMAVLCGDFGDQVFQWWGDPIPDLIAAHRWRAAVATANARGPRALLRSAGSSTIRRLPDAYRRRRLARQLPGWLTREGARLSAAGAQLPSGRLDPWTDRRDRLASWSGSPAGGPPEREAFGVSLAFPFLDPRVLGVAERTPSWVRGGPDDDRRLQRAVFADVLPPALLARRGKVHFDAKLIRQFAASGAPDVLRGMRLAREGFVDERAVQREADRLIAAVRADPARVPSGIHRLWTVVSAELWWRVWMG